MAGNKYLSQVSGQLTEVASIQTSSGAGDAGKIVSLDSSGILDSSLLPANIGAETVTVDTSADLATGDLVNIYDVTGTATGRLADASLAHKATGFVLADTTSGDPAIVYLAGINTGVSGHTAGQTLFLGNAGASTSTAPSTSGYISQQVGTALSATDLAFESLQTITLA